MQSWGTVRPGGGVKDKVWIAPCFRFKRQIRGEFFAKTLKKSAPSKLCIGLPTGALIKVNVGATMAVQGKDESISV
jgi:hypothetical protein